MLVTLAVALFSRSLEAQKNCKKGIPCGNTCIAANKTCRIGSSPSPAPSPTSRPAALVESNYLPPHEILADESLRPKRGRRFTILSHDPNLSAAQCRALVDHYRNRGAPDGVVSVRKPSQKFEGEAVPWCYDTFDGRGVQFNDSLF